MDINMIKEYLPFLIPVLIIQLGLMLAALYHVLTHKNYRFGNRILWVVIVVVIEFVGPIAYFAIGRGEE
jgi:hypothetical protein